MTLLGIVLLAVTAQTPWRAPQNSNWGPLGADLGVTAVCSGLTDGPQITIQTLRANEAFAIWTSIGLRSGRGNVHYLEQSVCSSDPSYGVFNGPQLKVVTTGSPTVSELCSNATCAPGPGQTEGITNLLNRDISLMDQGGLSYDSCAPGRPGEKLNARRAFVYQHELAHMKGIGHTPDIDQLAVFPPAFSEVVITNMNPGGLTLTTQAPCSKMYFSTVNPTPDGSMIGGMFSPSELNKMKVNISGFPYRNVVDPKGQITVPKGCNKIVCPVDTIQLPKWSATFESKTLTVRNKDLPVTVADTITVSLVLNGSGLPRNSANRIMARPVLVVDATPANRDPFGMELSGADLELTIPGTNDPIPTGNYNGVVASFAISIPANQGLLGKRLRLKLVLNPIMPNTGIRAIEEWDTFDNEIWTDVVYSVEQ